MKKYDVLVLGWGKAGKTLAAKLAGNGKKVAIVEKDPKMYGGTCINVGCLPTKSLANSSVIINEITKLGLERDYNIDNSFFINAMASKKSMVEKLNNKNYGLLANNPNVDVYDGLATFINDKEIKVNEEVLTADNIIINTGSRSRTLNIPVNNSNLIAYSDEILELEELPAKLLVVGAGFIGLEFASMFANFGSEVTVLQFDNSFLPSEDEEDAKMVKQVIEDKGIKLEFSASIKEINGKEVTYIQNGEEKVEIFDKVLISVGRIPNTEGLGIENTNIKLTERGEVLVDNNLETTVKGVWAAGDIKGGPQFTYVSLDDSRIILPQILGLEKHRVLSDRTNIATSTFIDPPYSRVGLNEKEADRLGIKYTKKYLLTAGIPKAHVNRETEGFSKVLLNENDEIIGAVLFHAASAEMINILSLAINQKIKGEVLRNFIYTHPTFTESLNDLI
ncbi:dihydrolipoyl dehydrogenase family protein [Pseudostreptobacillus hongkongensis]|uniref:dihydrolipoyl dehydrogenase family protein n=1 Tax=Pseudostreptobacillus hongkongensis TaxID=1162717 RepID=UPI000834E4BA|nr:FAD-dependent oxidoreductase [Pseudostreptobacillus hongkongensis]